MVNETLVSEQPLLIQLMLAKELLEEKDLTELQQILAKQNCTVEEALARSNMSTGTEIAQVYADHLHLPLIDDEMVLEPNKELTELVGEKLCREKLILPISRGNGTLDVAFVNPTDLTSLERVQLLTGLVICPAVASVTAINEALGEVFGTRDYVKEIASEASTEEQSTAADDVEEIVDLDRPIAKGRDSHVIRLVNHILTTAVNNGASDIHLESFENSVKVRLRIDGRLNEMSPPPKSMYIPMISRLKVLSKMDIAERRVPQDGAITLRIKDKRIDLRVSTVPTVFGEKMVMRILAKDVIPTKLTDLGFNAKQAEDFEIAADSPHGLLLVTGPTGSGKSTTLYATLELLNKPDVNILTVEDPVEYKFDGLNQVHVRSQVGLTFASALRAFLRQDPDVIMVGEVRDQETAQICLRAALTGHMVLSTLHTNGALAAINRMADMGIERFLLASALRLVEAQRLVRRLCEKCKESYKLDAETAEKWGLDIKAEYFRSKGCEACRNSGYKGRVGLFEVVRVTPKLRDLIAEGAALPVLKEEARKEGMMLLEDAGLQKVCEGVTSLEEVLQTCMMGAE